jgi:transcriptional regulator with XRE-family HTH domain
MTKRSKPIKITPQELFGQPNNETVGKRIAMVRTLFGWSQAALARDLKVSRGAVGQWEAEMSEPTAANLRNIALLSGVNFDWLATGRGGLVLDRDEESTPVIYEFTVTLPDNTTFLEAAEKLKELKRMAETFGTVTGRVLAGKQKFEL